jgi:transposase InsO family protein
MEAIFWSDTSAAACAKALFFSWISRFGVPETITSDRKTQFTSNIWSNLCEMLHISYRQTTAYHPESNGAVERLHRRLKDALRAPALRRLGLRSYLLYSSTSVHSRGKTLVFPRLRQFLVLQLPNEFLQGDEFSVDEIVTKKLNKL